MAEEPITLQKCSNKVKLQKKVYNYSIRIIKNATKDVSRIGLFGYLDYSKIETLLTKSTYRIKTLLLRTKIKPNSGIIISFRGCVVKASIDIIEVIPQTV